MRWRAIGVPWRVFARAASRFGPPIAWMCWIFAASTGVVAHSRTSPIFDSTFHSLFPGAAGALAEQLHWLCRKGGHIGEYALLAILWWRAFGSLACRPTASLPKRVLLVFLIAILYAASDEFHQSFVASRFGSVADVLLDGVGVLIGLGAALGFEFARRRGPGRVVPDSPEAAEAASAG